MASYRHTALSSIASKTGARSPGEELMTLNISAVAASRGRRRVALDFAFGELAPEIGVVRERSAKVLSGVALICNLGRPCFPTIILR